MSNKVFELEIYFDPINTEFHVQPYVRTGSIERFSSMVITKKNNSAFTKSEITEIQETIEDPQKRLDFSLFVIVSVQVETGHRLNYTDYQGQEISLGVLIKSAHTESNKLLHYLYQKTVSNT